MASVRGVGRLAFLLSVAALLAPACQHAVRPPAAGAARLEDFHRSDPGTIGATGRPQLLEFFGPT